MLAEVTIDGIDAQTLRRAIEDMVRNRQAEEAARHVRELLAPLCYAQGPLPAGFADSDARSISFVGWNLLSDCIMRIDMCGEPVSAIGFELSAAALGDDGEPLLATHYYFDTAWPFSECSYTELLDGFNELGAAWQNDHADEDDDLIALDGLAPLAEPLARLRARNAQEGAPSEEALKAELLGTLYLAVIFHIALDAQARRGGLRRPFAVLAATRDTEAGISAPVLSARDTISLHAKARLPEPLEPATGLGDWSETASRSEPDDVTPITPAEPGAHLTDLDVIDEDADQEDGESDGADTPEEENFAALFTPSSSERLRDPNDDPEAWHLPPPGIHTTGSQLRRKLVTEESISELVETRRPGLLARLFGRT